MRWGRGSERAVEAAEVDLAWSGPGRSLIRPMTYATARRVCATAALLMGLGALGSLAVGLELISVPGSRPGIVLVAILGALPGAAVLGWGALGASPQVLERHLPAVAMTSQVAAVVVVTVGVIGVGPQLNIAALFYVEAPLVTWMAFRTRWAVALTLCMVVGFLVALWGVDDPIAPAAQVLILLSVVVTTTILVGDLANRSDDAQRAERTARLALADLNEHLEARVAEQVDELERVGQLRRFLAPQVADLVVSQGGDALLAPHRRDVAVLFCDLRGFTRFTNSVEPDVIVGVLGEYYAAVGRALEAHGATIGGYDGDGVMAYLGDPIPHADAPAAAVAMARDVGAAVDGLVGRWSRAGYALGWGIGLAYGDATLGVVGFDGRFDYTPLGAVVNLAARLCADAGPGEIVIDGSMLDAAGGARHRGDVELKGYDAPVPTYALAR